MTLKVVCIHVLQIAKLKVAIFLAGRPRSRSLSRSPRRGGRDRSRYFSESRRIMFHRDVVCEIFIQVI